MQSYRRDAIALLFSMLARSDFSVSDQSLIGRSPGAAYGGSIATNFVVSQSRERPMKELNGFIVCLTVAGLSSCASGGLVSSWKAPDAQTLNMNDQKVAAVVMMSDQASRRAAEDALARELSARGADGVPMYRILPDADRDDERAAREAAERAGVAGVVAMRPVRTDKEVVSTPVSYAGPSYGGYWGGYYGFGWSDPWRVMGGEIRTDTIVSVETLVYSMRQNQLVWGGRSKTTNPTSVDRLVENTAKQVARELERQGLLPE